MRKNSSTDSKRFYKWLIIIVVSIIVLIGVVLGYFAKKVSPFIAQKLKVQVIRSSDSLYHIEFSKFNLNPLTGNISLTGFELIADTVVYNHLKELNRAPEDIFHLSVPKITLIHARLLKLLLHKEVQVRSIAIQNPVIKVRHEDFLPRDTSQSIKEMLETLVSGPLHSITIGQIKLNNITTIYKNKNDSIAKGFVLQKTDLILKDLYMDTTSIKDTSRIFYEKNLRIHLAGFKIPTSDSLYWLKLGDVVYSASQQHVFIRNLWLTPRYSESAFDKKVGHQQDRYNIRVDSTTISGLNLLTIIRQKKLGRLQNLKLNHANIDIYHNRGLPPKPGKKELPQQMLTSAARRHISKDIAAIFTIDTVSVQQMKITYRELNPKSRRIGTVNFQELHGHIYHISNDSVIVAKENHCMVDLHALFMGKGSAHVRVNFNLTSPHKVFSYSGDLGSMKADILNKATQNLGLVTISSGNIRKVYFNFLANEDRADGSVSLLYDNLSVKLLSADESKSKLKKKGLASLVANVFVLRNNNTTDTSAPRTTRVVYRRDPKKSFLNMMWKSLFEGVKIIVGMDKQKG